MQEIEILPWPPRQGPCLGGWNVFTFNLKFWPVVWPLYSSLDIFRTNYSQQVWTNSLLTDIILYIPGGLLATQE